MTQRSSRAGPTAFFAAWISDSCTAVMRISRLMPFSRSQYSKTAKKSAFIFPASHLGNKKVGRIPFSDFARAGRIQQLTSGTENRGGAEQRQVSIADRKSVV